MANGFAAVRVGIVVPCFNEESRLDRTAFERFLAGPGSVRLLFVNDGSTDDTLGVLHELQRRFPDRVQVIDQPVNRGKAEAVRVGMLRALGDGIPYVGYFDADLATPLEAIDDFVRVLDHNPDIDVVIGARVALLGRDIQRRASRHYSGRVFATAASLVLSLPVYDTQCGAKLLRSTPRVASLFEQPFGSRWIFDVELIARYLSLGGRREGLYELPVQRWRDVGESKVKLRDYVRAIGEMAQIHRRYFLGRRRERWLDLLSVPFLRYLTAGGVGTTFHYLLLILLVEIGRVRPWSAATAGSALGAVLNYSLNYHLTFAATSSHGHTLPRFAGVALLSALFNGAGVWVLTRFASLHYLLAQVLCTLSVLVFGYLLNRAWTFAGGRLDDAGGTRRPLP